MDDMSYGVATKAIYVVWKELNREFSLRDEVQQERIE